MRFKISKLDVKALNITEEPLLSVVEHLNAVIDEITAVTSDITFGDNFKESSVRTLTVRSGEDTLITNKNKQIVILESQELIDSYRINATSAGMSMTVNTVSGRQSTLKILII